MDTMRVLVYISFLFVFVGSIKAQQTFKPAYYIDTEGSKVTGFIDINLDNTGSYIYYKQLFEDIAQKLTVQQFQEFYFTDEKIKYVVFEVDFDEASDAIAKIGLERNPKMTLKKLFLKEEIVGDLSLYSYRDINKKRYFIKKQEEPIQQLIFKKYLKGASSNKMGFNNYFKQQLVNNFTCALLTENNVKNSDYTLVDMRRIILENNVCKDNFKYQDYKIKGRDQFNISIRPGIRFSNLDIISETNDAANLRNASFESATTFRIGVEVEYVLNKDVYNWAFIAEASYHQYTNETSFTADTVFSTVAVDYSAVDFAIGVRYYVPLSAQSKVFLNVNYITSLFENGFIDYSNFDDLEVASNVSIAGGVGVLLFDHFFAEIQLHSSKNLSASNGQYNTRYNNVVFIAGYKF